MSEQMAGGRPTEEKDDVQVPAILVLEDGGVIPTVRAEPSVVSARSAMSFGGGVSEER
ncbi:hypothetical protein HDA32_003810 [Spinactinospora alkalitolerans]|uniref:Uncharacterized protein n=1 Tax=Spinactinospora alkalitolerans TaxID=687207 RepID=A0A852U408_9ACTN|nr:hypothetical protein [Spinactinospora alkalitolerans]NYE48690.1 hypothetical protein [Spinactinospora alkalitolerans]